MASRKTKKREGGALRAQRASSNVFSNFEQTQIQEFKEAFTLMDQNRDGFIDKEDLKDTYASLGTDAEETILNAFKMLDPDGKGKINKEYIKRLLMSQADKMTADEKPHPGPLQVRVCISLPEPAGGPFAPARRWTRCSSSPPSMPRATWTTRR
ncbi:PREDICTED: myosin light chain 5 isoform X3 [Cercocebus atys]|uniref:myosin light chain 5 isoform X3 n=1 Tax=Cercocebus atys TaxID=9531 RepID=UPI0005F57F04|nr:PREDICTED: myosin light chain 5 isoform X3 [Cercocebus atys]